ncbi:MAG: Hpt domain-containing protein [Clostridia bacterium]|nr:Hpt domain-containing protein [Clostridia bacterium]MDE7083690.1 Hpt domain-containing protein [Clostridia bacterium]
MTVKEYYDACGGGYEEMISKFGDDGKIKMFLTIFKRDKSYDTLAEKLDGGDTEGAFSAAHTLKGVVLNLNLLGLKDPVCNIVEALRAGNLSAARSLFPAVSSAYSVAINALNVLLQ